MPRNTGPAASDNGGASRRRRRSPRTKLREPVAAASWGAVAARLRPSARPALIPPDQRLHQPVEHAATHAPADDLGDGRIGGEAGAGKHKVEPGPGDRQRWHHARSGQRPQPDGHAEHVVGRERPQRAAGPHEGLPRRRLDQVAAQAEVAAEVGGVGHAGQERVGTGLHVHTDADASQAPGLDLAAEAVGRLEQGDVGVVAEEPGGGQAGDPPAHHDHRRPVGAADSVRHAPGRPPPALASGRGGRSASACGRRRGRRRRPTAWPRCRGRRGSPGGRT